MPYPLAAIAQKDCALLEVTLDELPIQYHMFVHDQLPHTMRTPCSVLYLHLSEVP